MARGSSPRLGVYQALQDRMRVYTPPGCDRAISIFDSCSSNYELFGGTGISKNPSRLRAVGRGIRRALRPAASWKLADRSPPRQERIALHSRVGKLVPDIHAHITRPPASLSSLSVRSDSSLSSAVPKPLEILQRTGSSG